MLYKGQSNNMIDHQNKLNHYNFIANQETTLRYDKLLEYLNTKSTAMFIICIKLFNNFELGI